MKNPILVKLICILISLLISGCAITPLNNQPQHIMQEFKYYERIKISSNSLPWTETNIIVQKGDIIVFLVSGNVSHRPVNLYYDLSPTQCLYYKISDLVQRQVVWNRNTEIHDIEVSGKLKLGIIYESIFGLKIEKSKYKNNLGFFIVDIFVFEKNKEEAVPDLLRELARQNSKDMIFNSRIEEITNKFRIFLAERKTKQEIAKAENVIQKITAEIDSEDKATISKAKDDLEIMRAKLAQLTQQLEQLENLKKELKTKELQEIDLLVKLEKSRQRPPIVFIVSPKTGLVAEYKKINLYGVVEDDKAIERLEFFVNGELDEKISNRGIFVTNQEKPKLIEFNEKIVLRNGKNSLMVKATDSDGYTSEKEVVVSYAETRTNVWAVVIGIDNYQNVRHLKYATKDARAFYNHLVKTIKIPKENISLLLNDHAHLYEIRSVLGTDLKRKAEKDDMVMIFFAGHGATEEDSISPDGDGLEKYILPYDADLKNLYASALPMSEISKIFNRINSERLIFIADACYSGASGGRTIGLSGTRASISEAFLDRISKGKGRVIITASGANEISSEKDDLKHGVFTYYLLEGLKGNADIDKDGIVTVDEVYNYVSLHVPKATGQAQHPVKKGSVEGQLIMGVVE